MTRPPGCVCPGHDTYGDCPACQHAHAAAELADPHPSAHQEHDDMTAAALARIDWKSRAACLGVDPALFDPPTPRDAVNAAAISRRAETANRFCGGCPVRAACAAEADADLLIGLWGGSMRHRPSTDRRYTVHPLIPAAAGDEKKAS